MPPIPSLSGAIAAAGLAGFHRYGGVFADTRRRVGLVGCGWYGKSALLRLLQVAPVEVVSLCDVDRAQLAGAAQLVATRQVSKATPRGYSDYRSMLAERDLDLVIVSTPDHWHALPMIEAVTSGADVYVEKPTSVDVVESQAMLAAARRHGRVVQVGTQRRSGEHFRTAIEYVASGKLGKVCLVKAWMCQVRGSIGNPPDEAPPAGIDYDVWLGPAPKRPFIKNRFHYNWRSKGSGVRISSGVPPLKSLVI